MQYSSNYIFSPEGTITIVKLKEVMKSSGQNRIEKEPNRMVTSVKDNWDNEIDFKNFSAHVDHETGREDRSW